jgi:hypothetical protein
VRWSDEPGQSGPGSYWVFSTDNRESAGQLGTSRVRSEAAISKSAIGSLGVTVFSTNSDASHHQGQRSLTLVSCKDFQQKVGVPAARAAFHNQAVFARVLLEQR